eukprot:8196304-Ditylum_brightwellii.AAC.1
MFSPDCNKHNIQWARKTFKYANFFNKDLFPSTIYDGDTGLALWVNEAKSKLNSVLTEGHSMTRDKIHKITAEDYG